MPKYTKSGKGRGGSARNQGWSNEGMRQFNELVSMVIADRVGLIAANFENDLLDDWKEKADGMRKRKREGDDEVAQHVVPKSYLNDLMAAQGVEV